MKLCRFTTPANSSASAVPRPGLLSPDGRAILDLSAAGYPTLSAILEQPRFTRRLAKLAASPSAASLPQIPLSEATLLAPVDAQEVWAAGVTYLRSRAARMDESDFSARAYQHVYEAPRPEIFFKSLASKVVATREPVGIRRDATWSVPEPELALVLSSAGDIVGYTIGNDMSSRDIEGENLLYLPQAKIYDRACALGPWVVVGAREAEARTWIVQLRIRRRGREVFAGTTSIDRIQRRFGALRDYLFRSQTFPAGAVLLTGTGVVPGDDFTLRAKDEIEITISGLGTLVNPVAVV